MADLKAQVKSQIEQRREIVETLKKMIIDKLNLELQPEEIEEDAGLFGMGLGLDSIDALELAVGVEETFGISINDDQMEVFRSINSIVDYILANREQAHD